MKFARTIMLVTVLAAVATLPAFASQTQDVVKVSHAKAKQVFESAVDAMGGADALRSVETIILESEADLYPRLQTPTPDGPHEGFKLKETVVYDMKQNRLAIDSKNTGGGFSNHNKTIIANGEGQNFDLLGKTVTPIPAGQVTTPQFTQYYRRMPNLILATALQRQNTLRYLGEENFQGKPHDVITFVHADGSQIALYVDRGTKLLSKYELMYPDAITGDDAAEIIYDGFTTVNGVKVPTGWTWKQAGQVVGKFKYKVQVNPKLDDSTFAMDATGYQKAPANNAAARQVGVQKLAEGVHLVENLGGGNYNVMAVEFPDYIAVVEAPVDVPTSEQAIAQIKKAIPNKPIKYVVVTHFHSDHSGGLRAFAAEGATVITTPGNKNLMTAIFSSKRPDAFARSGRKPSIQYVQNGRHTLRGGDQVLELYEIGSPHAKEMMVAYLPSQRVLFQGDLFFASYENAPFGAPQQVTQDFYSKLKGLNLAVDKLAGVHGRVSNMQELASSLKTEGTATAAAR